MRRDIIETFIMACDKTVVTESPNYRAMLLLKTALYFRGFEPAQIGDILSGMTMSVSADLINDTALFGRLVTACASAIRRLYDQLIEDFGEEIARVMIVKMASQFTLDF